MNRLISFGDEIHIVFIAHSNCGMVNLVSKKKQFIENLSENGG